MQFKNFDINDVFGPNDTEEAKKYIGKRGYYTDNMAYFDYSIENQLHIQKLLYIDKARDTMKFVVGENTNYCAHYTFFLPLGKAKKVEPKKEYRVFKSMRELTEIVYGNNWEYNNLTVGDHLWIRRKGDEHYHQNILITSLEYDENNLISMNGKPMQEWLDNFEFLAHCEWRPFGVKER